MLTRLTHDISLEEFEDEDLSEITEECGISLQCKDTLSLRVRVGSQEPRGGGRVRGTGWVGTGVMAPPYLYMASSEKEMTSKKHIQFSV